MPVQVSTNCNQYVLHCDCVAGPALVIQTVEVHDIQDAEQKTNGGGVVIVNDNDLQFGLNTGNNDKIGAMRFTPNIPQGAVITNAYIQFTTDTATTTASSLIINAEAIDNSPAFTTAVNSLLTRPKTAAAVPWSPLPWSVVGERGTAQRTANITTVIQEVVDRAGWAPGNVMGIHIDGAGLRDARSFADGVPNSPMLHIEYQIPGTGVKTCTPFYREINSAGTATGNNFWTDPADGQWKPYTITGTVTSGNCPA